jgi:hypothetical protein
LADFVLPKLEFLQFTAAPDISSSVLGAMIESRRNVGSAGQYNGQQIHASSLKELRVGFDTYPDDSIISTLREWGEKGLGARAVYWDGLRQEVGIPLD